MEKQTDREGATDAARLIDAAVTDVVKTRERRAAIDDSADRGRSRHRAAIVALGISVPILVVSYLVNVEGWTWRSWVTPAPPAAVAQRQADDALQVAVEEIESFRRDYSELPGTMAEVGVPITGEWSYTTTGGHFRLSLRHHGRTATYDSATRARDHAPQP